VAILFNAWRKPTFRVGNKDANMQREADINRNKGWRETNLMVVLRS
jgi:hypothetical protein